MQKSHIQIIEIISLMALFTSSTITLKHVDAQSVAVEQRDNSVEYGENEFDAPQADSSKPVQTTAVTSVEPVGNYYQIVRFSQFMRRRQVGRQGF